MVIYDEDGNIIENPDLELGHLEGRRIMCWHTWVVDTEKQVEEIVVAEYENGGKDIEYRVIVPEEGHWLTTDENGDSIPFDGIYAEDWKQAGRVPDEWSYQVYIRYTEEELAEQQAHREETERQIELQDLIGALPDAVADLSAMVSDNTIDVADIADAIADLSEIVSELMEG